MTIKVSIIMIMNIIVIMVTTIIISVMITATTELTVSMINYTYHHNSINNYYHYGRAISEMIDMIMIGLTDINFYCKYDKKT